MVDYTGIWIPQRDDFPFTILACEHLSDNTKSTSDSTLECSSIDPWEELIYVFIVYDDWITHEKSNKVVGKYNVDGEIEWFDRSTNDNERRGKWKRPSVRDYIGVWEQVSEHSNEFSNIELEPDRPMLLRNPKLARRLNIVDASSEINIVSIEPDSSRWLCNT